jgi:hypothetical protein
MSPNFKSEAKHFGVSQKVYNQPQSAMNGMNLFIDKKEQDHNNFLDKWHSMNNKSRKEITDQYWKKARRFFKKRKQLVIENYKFDDDIQESNMIEENEHHIKAAFKEISQKYKTAWYLIEPDNILIQIWNEFIKLCLIYNFLMIPFVLTFPEVLTTCKEPKYGDCEV